eukprot:TRINITY_DN1506_c0_g1_i8.p1 TRINITY_DN1506_c0_g1~~TRINITY_DN1506_c0_g1_i8.p1  ORF type:complete len:425 (-),score=102.60 TRINITY_DN1506_c0_g1_i8:51-1325(-)
MLWHNIGISGWPSLVLLGPNLDLLLISLGGGKLSYFESVIEQALSFYSDSLTDTILPLDDDQIRDDRKKEYLSYPTSLTIDGDENIYVADSGHHRILVLDSSFAVIDIIGSASGECGLVDGSYEDSRFNNLQGIYFYNDALYVADTDNHSLRKVDTLERTVSTIAGTGKRGMDYEGGKEGMDQILSSPWGIVVHEESVVFSMAGQHQIWKYSIDSGMCSKFSGTGSESNLNSDNKNDVCWAQPSGIYLKGEELIVCDAESSSIRSLDVVYGTSKPIVGADKQPDDLKAFGDVDGDGYDVKLQHPLSVIQFNEESLLVADTYNHKIKLISGNHCETFSGTGIAGTTNGSLEDSQFSEPSGLLKLSGGCILVSDTNNHCLRLIENNTVSKCNILFFDLEDEDQGLSFHLKNGPHCDGDVCMPASAW